VVDKIATVATTSKGGHDNVPVTAIVITSAKVEGNPRPAAARPASPRPSPGASGAAKPRPRPSARPSPRPTAKPSPRASASPNG
jgi:hypothetical protein